VSRSAWTEHRTFNYCIPTTHIRRSLPWLAPIWEIFNLSEARERATICEIELSRDLAWERILVTSHCNIYGVGRHCEQPGLSLKLCRGVPRASEPVGERTRDYGLLTPYFSFFKLSSTIPAAGQLDEGGFVSRYEPSNSSAGGREDCIA
jgi:hypothetical protein